MSKFAYVLFAVFLTAFSIGCDCLACRLIPNAQYEITYTNENGVVTTLTATANENGCIAYDCRIDNGNPRFELQVNPQA